MIRTFWPLLALLGLSLVWGCASDDNPTDPGGGGGSGLEGVGTISGVVHRSGGFPSGNATISIDGASTVTNEDGYFVLSRVPAGEVLVQFSASGYATTYRSVSMAEGSSIHLPDVVLVSFNSAVINGDTGGAVSTYDGVGSIEFAPNSFVDGSGNPYDGLVVVYLVALQPQNGDFYGAFPGDYFGVRGDATEVPIESFGFMTVEVSAPNEGVVELAPGATPTLRLGVTGAWADRAPAGMPLWHFDEDSGQWLEEGSATLANDVYTAVVTHLSTWNWDLPIDDICGITGFVVNDSQQPVVGARVISRGADYRIMDETLTNADGLYTVQAVKNSITDVWAMSGSLIGEPQRVSVGDECPETVTEPLVVTVPAYSIALTWGEEPADLDAHLLVPMTWDDDYDYYQIAYFNMGDLGNPPYAMLDTDDLSSFGPEIITGTRIFAGRFQYWVNDFSTEDTGALAASGATVQLELGGALYLFEAADVSLEGANQDGWWHVFNIEVGGSSIGVDPVMRFKPEFSGVGVYEGELKAATK